MKTRLLAASVAALAALGGCVGYDGYGYGYNGYASPAYGGANGDHRNDAWRHDSQGDRDRSDRPNRRDTQDDNRY